jgi:hypothetical protein
MRENLDVAGMTRGREIPQLMSSVPLDVLKNVRIGFLLPLRHVIPVRHVGWFRIWEILEDLPDPAESHKASLL